MSVNIRSTKGIVIALLETFEHLRDSDERLIANVWANDLRMIEVNIYEISAEELMKHFVNGNLTSTESITRARRKVQEQRPELRGATYGARQEKQAEIKSQLKDD